MEQNVTILCRWIHATVRSTSCPCNNYPGSNWMKMTHCLAVGSEYVRLSLTSKKSHTCTHTHSPLFFTRCQHKHCRDASKVLDTEKIYQIWTYLFKWKCQRCIMLNNVWQLVSKLWFLTFKTYCNVEQSQQLRVVMFSPCESACVSVIVVKCCQGDTYSSEKYHRGTFEYFIRCSYICLSVDRFCMCDFVRNPARRRHKTSQMKAEYEDEHCLPDVSSRRVFCYS